MHNVLSNLGQIALFSLDPEKAHKVSIQTLQSGLLPVPKVPIDSRLNITVAGLNFPNPLGMAAGYDKNADVPDALLSLGFGHCEVGTVTPLPQPGNDRPRIFRLTEDKAVINRLGFNSLGHDHVVRSMKKRSGNTGIVGVNIGANKTSEDFSVDYLTGAQAFYAIADYLTINISSPNTPGLRMLQRQSSLVDLLQRVRQTRTELLEQTGKRTPIFLKIAPDLDDAELDSIAQALGDSDIDALIVSNTTLSREGLRDRNAEQAGGMSGKPLFGRSTQILAKMSLRLNGEIPLIGVGGVDDAKSMISKLEAGASLVQLYTGMIYQGPYLARRILKDLLDYLDDKRFDSIQDVIGTRVNEWATDPQDGSN